MATAAETIHVLVMTDDDTDSRHLASATRNLARELTRARFDVAVDHAEAPADAKGSTALTISSLVVSGAFSAATLQQLTRIVIAYIQRGSARKIKITSGKGEIVIDGASSKSERALIENWIHSHDGSPE